MIESLSASKLKLHSTCPLQYHYQYNLKLLQPSSPAMITGTRYHSLVEKFHNKELVEIEPTADAKVLTGLMEKYKKNPVEGIVVDTERKFEIIIGGIVIKGFIDRLDTDKIVEYKTTSKDYVNADVDNFQTDIYILAIYKTTGQLLPLVYSVNNKKKIGTKKYIPQVITIKRTEQDLVLMEKKIEDEIQKMLKDEFNPKTGQHCFWCPFSSVSQYAGTKNCIIKKIDK